MATPVYATLAQYRDATGDQTAIVSDTLLTRASSVIDELLIGATYTVDPTTELPTDTKVAEALRAATCAQVQWFDETGDTTGSGSGGELGTITAASIGSVSYSMKDSSRSSLTTGSGLTIAPGAVSALRIAGLLPVGVWVHG